MPISPCNYFRCIVTYHITSLLRSSPFDQLAPHKWRGADWSCTIHINVRMDELFLVTEREPARSDKAERPLWLPCPLWGSPFLYIHAPSAREEAGSFTSELPYGHGVLVSFSCKRCINVKERLQPQGPLRFVATRRLPFRDQEKLSISYVDAYCARSSGTSASRDTIKFGRAISLQAHLNLTSLNRLRRPQE